MSRNGPDDGVLFFANGRSGGGRLTLWNESGDRSFGYLVEAATGNVFVQREGR